MDVLVDALTASDLVRGDAPSHASRPTDRSDYYYITYPEYLFLLDLSIEVAGSIAKGEQMLEIDRRIDDILSVADWLAIYLDLHAVKEIYGIPIELVIPSADAARHLLSVRAYYGLSDREATNVLLAEERQLPFLARSDSISMQMTRALEDRGIPLLRVA